MVRRGEVGPIMLGRDHHDVSGTDSPFRETSNIKDGSNVMADMAVQCFAGNCARGMSLVALHNGGGVGIGKAINGGFGMVCDGSERVDRILRSSMLWGCNGRSGTPLVGTQPACHGNFGGIQREPCRWLSHHPAAYSGR